MFIRGRASESNSGTSQVRYGIEAFFAPKDKALDLEKRFRPGGVAKVMLAKNGKATLKDVVAE